MKKIFILLINLIIICNANTKNLFTDQLTKLKKDVYLLKVLPQNNDNTCGRHTLKNLIFFYTQFTSK